MMLITCTQFCALCKRDGNRSDVAQRVFMMLLRSLGGENGVKAFLGTTTGRDDGLKVILSTQRCLDFVRCMVTIRENAFLRLSC